MSAAKVANGLTVQGMQNAGTRGAKMPKFLLSPQRIPPSQKQSFHSGYGDEDEEPGGYDDPQRAVSQAQQEIWRKIQQKANRADADDLVEYPGNPQSN